MNHTCACHYGPNGRCIWCNAGVEDSKHPFAVPGVETLPPPTSYGSPNKGTTYVPFSSWGRKQARRSAMESLPADFLSITLDQDDENILAQLLVERRKVDPIIGSSSKQVVNDDLARALAGAFKHIR